jgi:hypothetical protein
VVKELLDEKFVVEAPSLQSLKICGLYGMEYLQDLPLTKYSVKYRINKYK